VGSDRIGPQRKFRGEGSRQRHGTILTAGEPQVRIETASAGLRTAPVIHRNENALGSNSRWHPLALSTLIRRAFLLKINNKKITQMLRRSGTILDNIGRGIEGIGMIPDREALAGAIDIHIGKLQMISDSLKSGGKREGKENGDR
tara:strand:- start:23280 stop:23714 length:435 start_codon:yes stop_codon:yes gene_type:complete